MRIAVQVMGKMGNAVMGARGAMLFFHRMARADEWSGKLNRGFYLNEAFVDEMLGYLRFKDWDFVTIEEMTHRMAAGELNRRFINFSLDDCYRDSYEIAVPLFRKHRVPLTLFVTTGIPDRTYPLWAAGLEDVLMHRDIVTTDEGTLHLGDYQSRVEAFQGIFRQWDNSDFAARYSQFCVLNDVDERAMHDRHAMSWEMLEAVKNDPYVEIGGHTISHPHVAALSDDAARHEIGGCMARLSERLDMPVRHFAFPYGRLKDCGPRDFEFARQAGLGTASTTHKGLLYPGADMMSLPRNIINGEHQNLAIMEAHLCGLTGLAERLKN